MLPIAEIYFPELL